MLRVRACLLACSVLRSPVLVCSVPRACLSAYLVSGVVIDMFGGMAMFIIIFGSGVVIDMFSVTAMFIIIFGVRGGLLIGMFGVTLLCTGVLDVTGLCIGVFGGS